MNICFSAIFHYEPTFGSTGTFALGFDGKEYTGSSTGMPSYHGTEVSIVRTLISSSSSETLPADCTVDNEDCSFLTLAIEGEYVEPLVVAPPDWCPPPPPDPAYPDTYLFLHYGEWQIVSGTGAFEYLQGTGQWVTYVRRNVGDGLPRVALECMKGRAHTN